MRLAFILLALCASAPLAAQERNAEKNALFRQLDTNGDGYLSREELKAPAALQGNWIASDRNGDGRISPSEFAIVRDFARSEPSSAAGGTRAPAEKKQQPKASGQP